MWRRPGNCKRPDPWKGVQNMVEKILSNRIEFPSIKKGKVVRGRLSGVETPPPQRRPLPGEDKKPCCLFPRGYDMTLYILNLN
jgi:hypothetical protein